MPVRDPSGGESIFLSTEKLELTAFSGTHTKNSLFSRLLAYLRQDAETETLQEYCCEKSCCRDSCYDVCCESCADSILSLLRPFLGQPVRVEVGMAGARAEGYVYRLRQDIVYLADDPDNPEKLYAVPAGRILSCRPDTAWHNHKDREDEND